jgi:protein TonB
MTEQTVVPHFIDVESSPIQSDSLVLWLFIAALIHALFLLGLDFSPPEAVKTTKAIEITVVNSAVRSPPKDAHYLAQENQIGAGLKKEKPKPNQQKIPEIGAKKPVIGDIQQPLKQKTMIPATQKWLTQKNKADITAVVPEKVMADTIMEPTKLSVKVLQRQIAQLGERIKYLKESAEKTSVKYINSISAHKHFAADYIRNWERKIEAMGNLHYPNIAQKKGFTGQLSMDVGILANGAIYNIRIVESSGNFALDEAAIRIVEMSAPFEPLPTSTAKQTDVLAIRRVWHFSDESRRHAETIKRKERQQDELLQRAVEESLF